MAIPIQSNFELRSKLPPFTIQQFKTLREMKLYPEYDIPEGITTYCLEDEKEYQWKSSNPDSSTTGKWKVKSSSGGKEEVYIGTDEPTDSDVVLWVDTDEPSGGGEGTTDYSDLENKPSINDVELFGNKTTQDLNLISDDEDNIIEIGSDGKLYATSSDGTIDYSELENKPSINDVELYGNKTIEDLDLISSDSDNSLILGSDKKLYVETLEGAEEVYIGTEEPTDENIVLWYNPDAEGGGGEPGGTTNYNDLENKPSINNVELVGNKTNADLGIFSKVDYTYNEENMSLKLLGSEGAGKELTEEHKTGLLLQGKPVYEITYIGTSGAANANKQLIDLNKLSVETLVSAQGFLSVNGIMSANAIPFYYSTTYWMALSASNGWLCEQHSASPYNNVPIIVTLRYTKK